MSDHGSSNNSPVVLIILGLLLIPASVFGQIYYHQYLVKEYGVKMLNIPAPALANIHLIQTVLQILPLIGVFIFFPLGLYMVVKSHMGGGH